MIYVPLARVGQLAVQCGALLARLVHFLAARLRKPPQRIIVRHLPDHLKRDIGLFGENDES